MAFVQERFVLRKYYRFISGQDRGELEYLPKPIIQTIILNQSGNLKSRRKNVFAPGPDGLKMDRNIFGAISQKYKIRRFAGQVRSPANWS
jgi:hypothetical protein